MHCCCHGHCRCRSYWCWRCGCYHGAWYACQPPVYYWPQPRPMPRPRPFWTSPHDAVGRAKHTLGAL